jgi:hypothetical protein
MMRRKDIFLMFFEALFSSSCESSLVLVVPKDDDNEWVI